jgi:hypothetical protein
MAVTIEVLRSYGARRVTLHCSEGTFDGSIVSPQLTDQTVMLLFALQDDPAKPIVIVIDGITEIVER